MPHISLPPMLTAEEEEEFDPVERYRVTGMTVIIKFGDYEIARYPLVPTGWDDDTYYIDATRRQRYPGLEEFLADKLRKMFEHFDAMTSGDGECPGS